MCPQLSSYHDELFYIKYGCYIVNLIIKDRLELIKNLLIKLELPQHTFLLAALELYRLKVYVGLTTRDPRFSIQTNHIDGIRPSHAKGSNWAQRRAYDVDQQGAQRNILCRWGLENGGHDP